MLGTHIRLICLNQTTVESLTAHDMRERERVALGRLHSWYQFRSESVHQTHDCSDDVSALFYSQKKETKKRWDAEWGKIDTEGNLWWLGSSRANWESVMGKNVWWWFCERLFIRPVSQIHQIRFLLF
jgi:palmitoyltransferase